MSAQLGLGSLKGFLSSEWQDVGEKDQPTGLLTVSRQAGAGGTTLSRAILEFMNEHQPKECLPWLLFDQNLAAEVAKEHHFDESVASYLHERSTPIIHDLIEELVGLHPSSWNLFQKTNETILRLARRGNVILVGQGGNLLTQRFPGAFHLRLIGSMRHRLEFMVETQGLTETEAVRLIKSRDAGRRKFIRQRFLQDIDDPLLYDCVLNIDHLSLSEVAQTVGETLLRRMRVAPKRVIERAKVTAN